MFGICKLNCIPVRAENSDKSEIVTQLLFGDSVIITEQKNQWLNIRILYDNYEGWIDKKQIKLLTQEEFKAYDQRPDLFLGDLITYVIDEQKRLMTISSGANLKALPFLNLTCEDDVTAYSEKLEGDQIVELALNYINTPYLWGGKTPFGIDCSGLTQILYKIAGYRLQRDASQQAMQGETLSFIEESQPGDLAFFDNEEGEIIHVGLLLGENYILHAHGKVRIDRIDHTGIFNTDEGLYSHQLRLLKKITA